MAPKTPKKRRAGTAAKAKRPAKGKPAAKKPPVKAKAKAKASGKAKAKAPPRPPAGARPAARRPPPPPKAKRGVLARLKRGVSAMAANAKGALGRMLGRSPSAEPSPSSVDEALAEPLYDMSGEHRLAAELARARDVDEDEERRFSDPSLVVEAEAERARDKRPGHSTLEVDDDDVVGIEPAPSRRRS